MVSDARRASSAADFRMSRRADSACVTLSLARLMAAPCVLRSSGDILPRVASRAEIEPFLPSEATRTASSAASSPAAAICSRMDFSSVARSDTVFVPASMSHCAYGASGDVQFGEVVEKQAYKRGLGVCGRKYRNHPFPALCRAEVARHISARCARPQAPDSAVASGRERRLGLL